MVRNPIAFSVRNSSGFDPSRKPKTQSWGAAEFFLQVHFIIKQVCKNGAHYSNKIKCFMYVLLYLLYDNFNLLGVWNFHGKKKM